MINGSRIRHARELRGYTQAELARRIGVRQPAIAQAESGLTSPSDETLTAIALQTGFPPAFFHLNDPPEFPVGSLMFRALRTTSARDRVQARRYGETIFEAALNLGRHVTQTYDLKLPELSDLTRRS
jgi:transcriptional regulator with XRE-family HTH domain